MLYRVEGIVIRSTDYGEGNKIVTLLTDTVGKVGVMARGAKKVRSRHTSLVQPFTYGEFVFFRNAGLGTLNAGEIMESNHRLREDLDLSAYAAYAAELCDRAFQDEEAGAYLFHQLKACYDGLREGKDPAVVIHLFEMKILEAAGYGPQLFECIHCGSDQGPFRLSADGGGILCRRCHGRDPRAIPLEEGTLRLLRVLSALDMRRLGNIQVRPETSKQLKTALRVLMDTHLDLRLKSRSFLDSLERFAPDPSAPAVPRRRMPAPESAEDNLSEAAPSGPEEAVDPEDA
ncbi:MULTISPECIES: DNA repair protein RecO [unclassified Paenibacillus]|uniref:DNA repair protein RecO n=1 Tax=unclassified Paenibacillus TaxID=185978 RepID=UPI00095625B9|nr:MULTISPECIES: DNA repair protein RecO [unclassified Paenibacillus]ASS65995.1 DNA repair protein RecO [Paenibacillus sp. RUD330]SIQ16020.1 DNA replication and repair protein RecO [Paenibacillus sp. RU4X]SIQ37969.1 DNA replication and repair protein RecO [Paenibacillus sp. RU4T]